MAKHSTDLGRKIIAEEKEKLNPDLLDAIKSDDVELFNFAVSTSGMESMDSFDYLKILFNRVSQYIFVNMLQNIHTKYKIKVFIGKLYKSTRFT